MLETMDVSTGWMATAVRLRLHLDGLEHTIAPEMLDRFAAGSATGSERRAVVRHLLAGCPSCSRHLGCLIPVAHLQEQESEGAYDQAFDRSLDHAFDVLKLRSSTAPATRKG